jgi:uncharacterized SAM-binding protein YcdF (DUF218 family)
MIVIIVILIGLSKNKKKLIYIAIEILYIISTPIFFNNFLNIIEGSENRKSLSTIESADAIIVLSGMLQINEIKDSIYIKWRDPDRFFEGIALFIAGKAQKLVFTGVKIPWNKVKKTEGAVLKEFAISNGKNSDKIIVTKGVENTAEEAVAVKELINPSKRIILVTSAYHMYRANRLFEKQGLEVIPYKVDYKTAGKSAITVIDFLPSAGGLELSETGIREIFGRIFYL